MAMKQFSVLAASLLCAAAMLSAQTQPVYWSATKQNCGSFQSYQLSNGGYVCEHIGMFPWYAAGGDWKTAIRTQAPSSGSVALLVGFYDTGMNPVSLDSTYYHGTAFPGKDLVSFGLFPNQPAELGLAGLASEYPNYRTTSTGEVIIVVQAPDAATCARVSAQLLYSALPSYPWSLSLPIAWLDQETNGYPATGIDNGAAQTISVIVYNDSTLAETIYLHAYDEIGDEVTGSPVAIPLAPSSTTGKMLRDLFPGLPRGIVKLKTSGSSYSLFEALQFNGMSAASLVIAPEGTLAPQVVGNSYSQPSALKRALGTADLARVHRDEQAVASRIMGVKN